MHILISGHTGFKGSWLILMLKQLGYEVSGIALPALTGSLFEVAELHNQLQNDITLDITEHQQLAQVVKRINPDVAIHLAAQALVLDSYAHPYETFNTNVMGTYNFIDACNQAQVQKLLVITTDKVYDNRVNLGIPFKETDPLGPGDPYSSSKAAADIAAQTFQKMPDFYTAMAIARGGNVIGGGDIAQNRLMVDLMRAYREMEQVKIRNPQSVRPWQHVLDCLAGYLTIIDHLSEQNFEAFNVAPQLADLVSVQEVVEYTESKIGFRITEHRVQGSECSDDSFGDGAAGSGAGSNQKLKTECWRRTAGKRSEPLHEAKTLSLDPSKMRNVLGWTGKLDWRHAVDLTVDWNKQVIEGADPLTVTQAQIKEYLL
ncbi:MAG: CDP-glucose 4,6-dehydratase [Bifidobacteriaceae bacterium]|jgi:CDP-glucose 4,6-dehydratase|nr:CDP-glucose 4,6-dehydratase [Bifidobacteriaceae bacterium]